MPDFVLAFATYKFLKNFMFMISPYQFGKEQFNFVCVCVCVCVYRALQNSAAGQLMSLFSHANYSGGEMGSEFVICHISKDLISSNGICG